MGSEGEGQGVVGRGHKRLEHASSGNMSLSSEILTSNVWKQT